MYVKGMDPDDQPLPIVKKKRAKPPPDPWFGRKTKILGRPNVLFNDATDEFDVLSMARYSGIETDEELSDFMLRTEILESITSSNHTLQDRSKKATCHPEDKTVITRYYIGERPDISIPQIRFEPSPREDISRWAVRNHLIATMSKLLDESQHGRVARKISVDRSDREVVPLSSEMVTFRGERRDLGSITVEELKTAANEVTSTQSIGIARELLTIRTMMQANAEEGMKNMMTTMRELEERVRVEQELRREQTDQKEREIAALRVSYNHQLRAQEEQRGVEDKERLFFKEWEAARRGIEEQELRELVVIPWKLSIALFYCQRSAPLVTREEQPDMSMESLKRELADAKLEITRLKDNVRGKAIPKPKTHRRPKDPDIRIATDAEIKSSVKSHLSSQSEGYGTPISRSSTVASRARRIAGITDIPLEDRRKMEERELEVAYRLKSLSQLRQDELCKAEIGSEQLSDILEALSSMLTNVTLTIEDVSARRTEILNHMRSLALHGRDITMIVRERPYLLGTARRMNKERTPMVKLSSVRDLVNVAENNLKMLREVENITLDSVGGAFEVMSLEEAAETDTPAPPLELGLPLPLPPSRLAPSPRALTKASLSRHARSLED